MQLIRSRFTHHVSLITLHLSRVPHHVSLFTFHASRIHSSGITIHSHLPQFQILEELVVCSEASNRETWYAVKEAKS